MNKYSMLDKSLHPVISLILQRAKEKSKPGKRTDKFKVGLAIEGGTMRGVVSAGMLVAMQRLGLRDSFDAVYGTSAGAANGTWFVSNQIDSAINTYYQRLNNFSFINPLRFLRKKPVLNFIFFEKVVEDNYPLDFEEVKKSGISINVLAARVDQQDGNPLVCLSDFKNSEDLISALHAGTRLPVLVGGPYDYKGMKLWDGGLIERIPLETAIKDGCTHVLALFNEPEDIKHGITRIQKAIILRYLKKYSPHLVPIFASNYDNWNKATQLAKDKQRNQDGPPFVAMIALSAGSKNISGLELRHKILIQGAKRGMQAVLSAFGLENLRVEEELIFTDQRGEEVDFKNL